MFILNFKLHVDCAATKAHNTGALIARPNDRLLISRVVSSMLNNTINKRKIGSTSRISAPRTCCAYRTTSDQTACVIAGMIPVDILTKEGQPLYDQAYLTGETLAHALCGSSQERSDVRNRTLDSQNHLGHSEMYRVFTRRSKFRANTSFELTRRLLGTSLSI